jgi:hypothetical protein
VDVVCCPNCGTQVAVGDCEAQAAAYVLGRDGAAGDDRAAASGLATSCPVCNTDELLDLIGFGRRGASRRLRAP